MKPNHDRRDFLKNLGLGAAALGSATLLGRAAKAGIMPAGMGARAMLGRVAGPSQALVLEDRGDGYHYLLSSGLPDHATGEFPNPNCPGPILARGIDVMNPLKIAKAPAIAAAITPLKGWLFGIAVNGVSFDPTGPSWQGKPETGWEFEVLSYARAYLGLDFNNAHSQPSGEYHYHGLPAGLIANLQRQRQERQEAPGMLLIGWAADGFPIYGPMGPANPRDPFSPLVEMRSSYSLKSGPRPAGSPGGRHEVPIFLQDYEYRAGSGDLDECNGRFGATPEFPGGIYHYFVTNSFPYVPRYWKGKPDSSFVHPQPGLDAVPEALRNLDYSKI